MGLYAEDSATDIDLDSLTEKDVPLLERYGCKVCPLAQLPNQHPDMAPSGASKPLVYILGEAPGQIEDVKGIPFVGSSGQILRRQIPQEYKERVRFNNVVRTRPHGNATPTWQAIACCRPSVVRDIEESRPKAIFGFGNTPLHWVCSQAGITAWRGRHMPVKVGKHTTWYFPIMHPAALLHNPSPDDARVFEMDVRNNFALVETLPKPVVHSKKQARANIELLKRPRDVKAALRWASKQPAIGIDYETNCIRPYSEGAQILTIAVATGERGFAFPVDHPENTWREEEKQDVLGIWYRFLEQTQALKVVHNLAFELEWTGVLLGQELIRIGHWEDTICQAAILDERTAKSAGAGPLSLEFLVQQYFGFNIKALAGLDRANLAEAPLDDVLMYNAVDARYHLLLWDQQQARIVAEGLEAPYQLQLRRVPTVVLSQMKGVPVDQAAAEALHKKYTDRLARTKLAIAALPIIKRYEEEKEQPFKPLSNPACAYIYSEMLKRPECQIIDKRTRKPRISVAAAILESINDPLAKQLLILRKATKRLSAFIRPLQVGSKVLYPDGQLHASLNTVYARTGRLSANSPNVQQWPRRDDEAQEVRRPIVAAPGCLMVAIDYGQLEARILAAATKDKRFVKALWEGHDVHGEWAERLAHAYPKRIGGRRYLTDKKVMKAFRTDIKNQWTFPLFFGAMLESASKYLSIPEYVLKPHYEAFWKEYEGVKAWQEKELKFYEEYGYVECLTGRRRHAPLGINKILNSPIQGTAADLVMDAMSRLSETGEPIIQPELNVHDDLTFMRIPEGELEAFLERILDIMLKPVFLWINVPITVEVSIGKNWMPYDERLNPDGLREEGQFSSSSWFR